MADSFADLWNSTVPPPKTQTLGSISRSPAPSSTSPATASNAYRRPDAFSILSSAGSSTSNSRSLTPASAPKPNEHPPKSSNGDAFSNLLSGALSSKADSRMTMAERAALVEKQRREASLQTQTASKLPSAWDGLDSLGGAPSHVSIKPAVVEDDWGLGDFASAKPSPAQSPPAVEDDWGLGDFSAAPAPPMPARKPNPKVNDDGWGMDDLAPSRTKNLWDMDEFTDAPRQSSRRDSPSNDFDFGNREDGLLGNDDDNDDILGDLAKPPDHSRRPSPTPRTRDEPVRHSSKPQERAVSPPPHILGRIVEMGFSIQEARIALASTDTGLDVEAALEALLSNGVGTSSARPSPPPSLPRRPTNDSTSSQSPPPRRREPQTSAQAERNLQEQADKIMAQASQIGLSFLSKANAAWKEGRERVQKAYVERVADHSPEPRGSTRTPTNGRPKWMQDNNGPVNEEPEASANGVPFSDHNDDPTPNIRAQARAGPPTHTQQPPSAPIGDLLAVDDGPAKPYVSPFRRKAVAPAAPSPQPQPRKTQTPPSRPLRNLVTTSSASIATSRSHKDQGADKFKLGQYGDAETAYTRAIECLPTAHLLLIPLYNNRALVRLKTGDYVGAVADCGTVIELVDEGTWQDEQRRSKSVEEGAGVDLGDSLVKAWKRRAEALEGREKWAEAKQDWERVAGAGWSSSSLRSDGVRGAGRCRKMVAADKQEQNPAPPKPKPRPAAPKRPPARRGPTPPSQALTNLKKANDAAAAEDDEKYQLKDRVDAKLTAWRGGKETNIRALIASLDSVLWPEVGLQKTSIAELVTPSQVKIRYTKAIAKLHPDKLNANNSTIEQRMIANGVFGTLNEAWNAFKQ